MTPARPRLTRLTRLADRLRLPPGDLWRDPSYLRLWSSILTASFGNQVMMLALPLTAAVLLQATPTQMGLLTAIELLPFLLLSLPSGVWLDRVRKLPVYVVGELLVAAGAVSVPLAWWLGWLTMEWLYLVGFVMGAVHTVSGSAAQIVLTQVVPRERLVEAHAKNALASSGAEVVGPGLAGFLIKLFGAPVALLFNAALLIGSAAILKGTRVQERRDAGVPEAFWPALVGGLRFVAGHRLLVALAVLMGGWQMAHYAAVTVQILFATRTLGLTEPQVGLSYMGMGVGTIVGSVFGRRISLALGPGPCLVLRQAVTPAPLLGRMTSTMRWLTLLAAAPGALFGGWLAEHVGLRATLAFAGGVSVLLVAVAWRLPLIRELKSLPQPERGSDGLGLRAEAGVRPAE